jgi:hypothetical protein
MSFPTTPGSHRRAWTRTTRALLATAAVALSGAVATTGVQADPPPAGDRAGQDETISVTGGYAKFHHHGEIVGYTVDHQRDECSEFQAAIA